MLCIPDAAQPALQQAVQTKMIDHCSAMEDRFALLDGNARSPTALAGISAVHPHGRGERETAVDIE